MGAGRTDKEYKEAEEQRCVDIRAESRSAANFFFWAAGLAALGTGLLPIRLNVFVTIGARPVGLLWQVARPTYFIVLHFAAAMWVIILVALGFVGRIGYRWAFLAGIVLYGADMIALVVTFSIWAFAVHAVFVFKWFQGQKALKDVNELGVSTF